MVSFPELPETTAWIQSFSHELRTAAASLYSVADRRLKELEKLDGRLKEEERRDLEPKKAPEAAPLGAESAGKELSGGKSPGAKPLGEESTVARSAGTTEVESTEAKSTEAGLPGGELAGGKLPEAELAGGKLPGVESSAGNPLGEEPSGAELNEAESSGGKAPAAELPEGELVGGEVVGGELAGAESAGGELVGGELAGDALVGGDLAGADLARLDLAGGGLPGSEGKSSEENSPGEKPSGTKSDGKDSPKPKPADVPVSAMASNVSWLTLKVFWDILLPLGSNSYPSMFPELRSRAERLGLPKRGEYPLWDNTKDGDKFSENDLLSKLDKVGLVVFSELFLEDPELAKVYAKEEWPYLKGAIWWKGEELRKADEAAVNGFHWLTVGLAFPEFQAEFQREVERIVVNMFWRGGMAFLVVQSGDKRLKEQLVVQFPVPSKKRVKKEAEKQVEKQAEEQGKIEKEQVKEQVKEEQMELSFDDALNKRLQERLKRIPGCVREKLLLQHGNVFTHIQNALVRYSFNNCLEKAKALQAAKEAAETNVKITAKASNGDSTEESIEGRDAPSFIPESATTAINQPGPDRAGYDGKRSSGSAMGPCCEPTTFPLGFEGDSADIGGRKHGNALVCFTASEILGAIDTWAAQNIEKRKEKKHDYNCAFLGLLGYLRHAGIEFRNGEVFGKALGLSRVACLP
ncbi:hypothetical protein BJ508DRAFT_10743 [Ascobolus immersus RN42]|uniref:Uncharacterized protein n=1 Tax=Ascobolus immersus RN42 TaxID=1160509 RepID=A0A3N4HUI5_ASCIM|nr:hypothetical protein BJ508DRAFT_10743 [Ascobolus immersus RN42]